MKILILIIFSISVFLLAIYPTIPTVNAHTWCGVKSTTIADNQSEPIVIWYPEPQQIGKRLADIEVSANPIKISSQDQNVTLSINLCDTNSIIPIHHVTYELSISPANQTHAVFHDVLHSHTGLLTLNLQKPTSLNGAGSSTNETVRDPSLLNALIASGPNGSINVTSQALHQVGEYDINVKILGIDEDKIIFNENNATSFHYLLDIGDKFYGNLSYKNQNFTIAVMPSIAKVDNFSFDPNQMKLSWLLSTKGTIGYPPAFSNAAVKVYIPKSFAEFYKYSSTLIVTVNGIDLPSSDVYIGDDPESKENFGILIDTSKAFQGMLSGNNATIYQSKTFAFSLSPARETTVHYDTLPSRVSALVSWNPNPPTTNKTAIANIKFFTSEGQPLNRLVYDIYMHDETTGKLDTRNFLVAANGTDFQQYNFSNNGIYRMHLYVRGQSNSSFPESINNFTKGDADGYVFVVPEFPVALVVLLIAISSIVAFSRIKPIKF